MSAGPQAVASILDISRSVKAGKIGFLQSSFTVTREAGVARLPVFLAYVLQLVRKERYHPLLPMDQHASVEQSFLKLYDEFSGPLFRHCYFRVSSREVAEDLTQELFMRIWNHLAAGKTIDKPKAFLYRIAGNLIIDYYRKKKELSLDALGEGGYDPPGASADSILDYAAGQHALSLVAKLESPYREVLIMRYVDGLSLGDIAQIIGESENTVSVRIHRGVEKLKKLFHYEKPN